jgi:hypothetical protein
VAGWIRSLSIGVGKNVAGVETHALIAVLSAFADNQNAFLIYFYHILEELVEAVSAAAAGTGDDGREKLPGRRPCSCRWRS